MQSFFRSNPNTNQTGMQSDMPMQQRNMQEDMPMREPVYTQNMTDAQMNMPQNSDMWQNQNSQNNQSNQNDRQMQQEMRTEMRTDNSQQQPTRPTTHGFVAPSGSDNYFENSVAYQGAMQQILSENTGELVSVDFLIGTQETVTRRGILYAVGVSYIVLYNPENDTYVVCDLFAIKFVTFYNTTEN